MSTPRRAPTRRAPDDHALAWALAVAAQPHLGRVEADRVYIAIGVGEPFTAIDTLLTAIARDRIPISYDLAATVAGWLDCYRGHETQPRLRQLLAEIESHSPHHTPAFEERFASVLIAARDRRSG